MSTPAPPDWATAVPSTQAMHNIPAPSAVWQDMADEQRQALWNKLLESVWQQFMLWVQGVLFPGPAGEQILAWATAFINDITTLINSIVNFLGGNTGSWGSSDVAQPLLDTATILASLNAQIDALKREGATGQSVIVDFSTYPDSTNLPSIFSETYGGSGNNPFGVTDGRAKIGPGNYLARSVTALYNVFVTDGDDQEISAVWTGKPINDGIGNRGFFYLNGRVGTDGRVFAEFTADSVTLGCETVGLGFTALSTLGTGGSGAFSFKPGAIYTLSMTGTLFTLKENTATILAFNDASNLAELGAAYRGGGIAATWPFSLAGNVTPGELLYWAFSDV